MFYLLKFLGACLQTQEMDLQHLVILSTRLKPMIMTLIRISNRKEVKVQAAILLSEIIDESHEQYIDELDKEFDIFKIAVGSLDSQSPIVSLFSSF